MRIGKISQVYDKKEKRGKKPVVAAEPEPERQLRKADLAQYRNLLSKYGDELAAMKRKSLAQYFYDPIIELKEDAISWTVGSNSLKAEIEEEHLKLRPFFEKNGFVLPVITCVIDAERTSKPMTQKERFEEASKKYPILNEFAERFGLDFNY